MKIIFLTLALSLIVPKVFAGNVMDELDPNDPNIEDKLLKMDEDYERETGMSPYLPDSDYVLNKKKPGKPPAKPEPPKCKREACGLWADVDKKAQRLFLYVDGVLTYTWRTSSGKAGTGTPNFEKQPDGRVYDFHMSSKFPGGDYNGLGNMPYAVFIDGGFAIHGTTRGNWSLLGQVASHGCVRVHPDNGFMFNRLVREYGVKNTWISVR
jgi:lipoprotein-anchoring transpeptidase ErfK/SrfK